MKIQKILLSLLLCFALLLASPVAHAEEPEIYTDNYLQYTIENGSITIVNYYGPDAEVTVPASIGEYPVNVIAEGAFASCENVTKINLPDCIMTVEQGAFAGTQTIVYDSNTGEPISREPDVKREQEDQKAAVSPIETDAPTPEQNAGDNQSSNQESTSGELIADFGEGEGDMVGVPVDPSASNSAANAGSNNASQPGSADQPANQSNAKESGTTWIIIGAVAAGLLVLGGVAYFLWRKKNDKD